MTDERSSNSKSSYYRELYLTQRQSFIDFLGSECASCGSTEDLEIDHIDPREKSFNVSRLWGSNNLDVVFDELKKCQLLCHLCHLKKTKDDYRNGYINTKSFTHGTMYGWMKRKCPCNKCLASKEEHNSKRRSRNKTQRRNNEPSSHGTYKTYKRGCRCGRCKSANSTRSRHFRETGILLPTTQQLH